MDPIAHLQTILGDRYTAERELGRGGMATVYLAHDNKHERQVAVKVLRSEIGALLGAERFLHEIKLTSRLNHPHILPLYDSGEHQQVLYYVMPFIEGESLREKIKREKRMRIEDAVQIAREVADALGYAHGHNIVHRDIKPENILLSNGHALVADFGIARAISRAGGEKWETLTASGVAIGTPAYMSPEQTVGLQDLDARSDVYSLGCVLFEMLVGEPPFIGPDGELMVARRFTEPAPEVRKTRETVPVAIEAAIAKALARDPSDRFASATEMADALAAAFMTVAQPIHARPKRAPSWIALAIGAAAAVAVAGLAIYLRRPPAPAPAGTTAQPPVTTAPQTTAPTPSSPASTPPTVATAATETPSTKTAVAAPKAAATSVAAPVPRREGLAASSRTLANDARKRAVDAGATTAELAAGDASLDAAEALAGAGRTADAQTRVETAISSWGAAERTARARVVAAAQQPQVTQQPPQRVAPAPVPPVVAPIVEAPVNPRPAIEAAVADYARAIQSRDVGELRRAYPGITGAQQSGWEQFFQSTQSVKASLTIGQLDVNGASAEATVAGAYDYVDSNGRADHRPVSFHLTLRKEGSAWRIAAVR